MQPRKQEVATITQIRQAVRALRNSLELKGQDDKQYNVVMGISFNPARNLDADQLIAAIEKNRIVSPKLRYGFQAGMGTAPVLGATKEAAIETLSKFDEDLAALPQDSVANMQLEFTVSNKHEAEIIKNAQEAIQAIQPATTADANKATGGAPKIAVVK